MSALKFRGREMAHTEVGFEVIKKFIAEIEPFGHPDFQPKLVGRAINLMMSPLPRNKRAKNPRSAEDGEEPLHEKPAPEKKHEAHPAAHAPKANAPKPKVVVSEEPQSGGLSSPFANLEIP